MLRGAYGGARSILPFLDLVAFAPGSREGTRDVPLEGYAYLQVTGLPTRCSIARPSALLPASVASPTPCLSRCLAAFRSVPQAGTSAARVSDPCLPGGRPLSFPGTGDAPRLKRPRT